MVMSFAACNKAEQNPDDSQTINTTSADNTIENATQEDLGPTLSPVEAKNKITGTWTCEEIISPKTFYGSYYNKNITKTNVQMTTTYNFNKDGSYSTNVTILNISDVRKEYRSLMVAGAKAKVEKEGNYLTTDDVLYYEKYADDILKDICKTQKGTYKIKGNTLKYSDGTTEEFAVKGNQLLIKGSTQENGEYKMILNKK
jgi:hypothetical protein